MSSQIPDTRYSLIMRLPDRQDVQAWDEFVSIYEPLIYRLARGKGLQHADAQEVVQEVLIAISKAVEHWQPDARLGRFRDWLFRISRNLVINYLTRRKYRGIGTGDSRIADLLAAQHAPDEESSQNKAQKMAESGELFKDGPDKAMEKLQPLNKEGEANVMRLLTDSQKKKIEQLRGQPFEFPKRMSESKRGPK